MRPLPSPVAVKVNQAVRDAVAEAAVPTISAAHQWRTFSEYERFEI